MYDNLDGTYSYETSFNLSGTVTVSVLLYTNGGVSVEYFPNSDWSGAPSLVQYNQTINTAWYSGTSVGGIRDNLVTARFNGAIRAPTTTTVTIHLEVDDTAQVYINDLLFLNNGYGNFSKTSKFH